MKKISLLYLIALSLLTACQNQEFAEIILINGNIVTLDSTLQKATAIAIKDGRIIKVGSDQDIKEYLDKDKTRLIDLDGQFTMPGFIEGHGHFSGLGASLINLNFLKSKNWEEIVAMVAEKVKTSKPGEWIEGRGWHQEKWDSPLERQVLGYPYHDLLSEVSPDNPVILRHASGHGLIANAKAMAIAGVSIETPNPSGGEIVRNASGEAIGVFEERAMYIISRAYKEYKETLSEKDLLEKWYRGIELAEEACLANGITSFQDAGSPFKEIKRYKKLAEEGKLNIRLWAMIRDSLEKVKGNLNGFPILNAGNHFFTVKAIKSEVDGALGSYGAWLLRPYDDKPNFVGQNTTTIEDVQSFANLADQHHLQLCVHAIGDRANREVLDIFENTFKNQEAKKGHRWRMEHAQHLHPDDIPRFKELGVIASMQGIHCTSDAPFVVRRLGPERSRIGAYPWRSLLDNGVVIANGTDAPVEDISPIACFYASVTRKRADNGFEFFPEQRMTRAEAIYSYTLGNAYAAFEENDKGSISAGKLADLVVLSKDLLNCSDEEILETEVLYTIVGGEVKYEKK